MGQIQQALTKILTASVVASAGVKKAEEKSAEKLNAKDPEIPDVKIDKPKEELSMDNIYQTLLSTGANATDISKGFTAYRHKQRENFLQRLEDSKKKEGDK